MCARIGIPSIVLRLFNTYGPGQALSPYVGVVTIFINALSRSERPTIFGDGEQRRDFVHVEDIARAFVASMDAPSRERRKHRSGGAYVNKSFLLQRRSPTISAGRDASPAIKIFRRRHRGRTPHLGYRPVRDFHDSIREVAREVASG